MFTKTKQYKRLIDNVYYVGYAANNNFSGNLASIIYNNKDITNEVVDRLDSVRYGKTLEDRNRSEKYIVLYTIKKIIDVYGKVEIRTNCEYVSKVINGQCKAHKYIDLIDDIKEQCRNTKSIVLYEGI